MSNSASLAGVTCLVLGARGFIGSHLTDALLEEGANVRAFDRPGIQSVKGVTEDKRPGLTWVEGDFVSTKDLEIALSGVNICFHLVSTNLPKMSNLDPAYDIETNLMGSIRLLNAAVLHKVKRVIFTSSGGTVYGNPTRIPIAEVDPTEPTCSYGITKLAIEKYLALYSQLHQLQYTVLRLANPYGERQRIETTQGAIAVFLGRVLLDQAIEIWGDGSVVRDYIHISDVVRALTAAATAGTNQVINIGSGQGTSINALLHMIREITEKEIQVDYRAGRGFDVPVNVLDVSRAARHLEWEPKMGLRAGISQTWQWMKQEYGSPI